MKCDQLLTREANGRMARVCFCLLMNFNSRKFDLMLALYGEQPIN